MFNNSQNSQLGPRQQSLSISSVAASNQSSLINTNKYITRGATCDETSLISSAINNTHKETKIPNIGVINNKTLKAPPFKRLIGLTSPLLNSSYTAINQPINNYNSTNELVTNLSTPIDATLVSQKLQSQVSVTLNGSNLYNKNLKNNNNSSDIEINNCDSNPSTYLLPRVASETSNELLTTSNLNSNNKSQSLSNLENTQLIKQQQKTSVISTKSEDYNLTALEKSSLIKSNSSLIRQDNLQFSLDSSNDLPSSNLNNENFDLTKQLSQTSSSSFTTMQLNQSNKITSIPLNKTVNPIRTFPRQPNIVAEVKFLKFLIDFL